MNSYLLITTSLFFWLIFILQFNYDRSRYRNTLLLFLALSSSVPALCSLAGPNSDRVFYYCCIVFMIAIMIVPFFLMVNGIVMFRREGHSLAKSLSFILGVVIGIGELMTFLIMFGPLIAGNESKIAQLIYRITLPAGILCTAVIYGSVVFLMFMLYSVFLQLIPRRRDFDYVIIHGAGLLGGDRVSKLLADRIDKAIEVYNSDPTPPVIIPSGGKGGDETISEAEAMARYLKEHGIPEDKIILEDQSATTLENLRNCKAILDGLEGRKYTTLVTSNYHVYRALRYCRKIGLDCTGIGSRVAFYYWPSALIREFIAIHSEKKHAIMFTLGLIITVALFTLPLF